MEERPAVSSTADPKERRAYWFQRLSRPTLFLIVSLALVGAYLAFTIPVSVFPNTDFPRVVIGVDNGVMPIDQMLVTITRPIEEAVNSVPGLQRVVSTTSRGSAEVSLFFDWNSDMVLTLQRVDAVVARLQSELPATTKVETHRLTFATFPILGYSLTSDSLSQDKLWEIATYDIKPRLNRLDGVASVLVQGGRVPEFQVTPDPARLLAAGITVADILDAIRRTNLIDSPGLLEHDHQLVLGLVSGRVQTPEEIAQIVVKSSAAGVPTRLGDIAAISRSVAPVYTMVTANGKQAASTASPTAIRSPSPARFISRFSNWSPVCLLVCISSRSTISPPSCTTPSLACATPCCLVFFYPPRFWSCFFATGVLPSSPVS